MTERKNPRERDRHSPRPEFSPPPERLHGRKELQIDSKMLNKWKSIVMKNRNTNEKDLRQEQGCTIWSNYFFLQYIKDLTSHSA